MTNEPQEQQGPTKRDMETVMLIGFFLVFFALATLAGSLWDMNFRARVVNTVAALVLLGIGAGALWWAKSMSTRIR